MNLIGPTDNPSMGVLCPKPRFGPCFGFILFACWGSALSFGVHKMLLWDSTPAAPARVSPGLNTVTGRPTLVVVLHSQCPCSLATVSNIQALPPAVLQSMRIQFVVSGPDARTSGVVENASLVPGATTESVTENEALRQFGAQTSGQSFLYDSAGQLVFSGGLTDSRGHEGPSLGIQAILDCVAGRPCQPSLPVFGCAVQTPGAPK